MASYSDRYHALCGIIDDLPSPPGDEDNRFQLSVASGSNTRSLKLDYYISTNKSRKGKEVERYAQIEQLRLSERDFENLGQIGDGQFGSVSAVRCKLDGQVYAMKTIKKFTAMRAGSQMNLPLERYIHTLSTDHGRAPEMVAAFQSDSVLHLMTTYAAHGSLWDRMCSLGEGGGETSQAGRMAEDEIRWWARQMVGAIEWLHGKGFAHRDIKPHNFLIHSPTRLTLTDFGSAASLIHPPPDAEDPRSYVKKQHCLMPIGTPDYIAPEILKMAEDAMIDEFDSSDVDPDKTIRPGELEPRGYGADVDWWSFGATIYEMSAGEAPFYARTVRETYELITKCGEGGYQPATAGMSTELRSALLSLLTASDIRLGTDPTKTVSAHPFFTRDQHEDHPPQSVLSLPLIEIGGRGDQTDTEVTFDHHFQSSVGMTTTLTSSCSTNQTTRTVEQSAPDRWCGWTWIPPAHAFSQSSSPTTSNRPMRPLPRQVPPVTPARTSASIAMPMTTPRSKVRSRPISDKRAMAELVKCVQHSARKRASSVKPRFPSGQLRSVGKEAWTPTPKPRPVLVERDSKQNEPGGVERLVARQIKLEDGLTGLEKRFARLKTRLQTP